MDCPKCGYVMDPFTTECPRCARAGAVPGTPPPAGPQPGMPLSDAHAHPHPPRVPGHAGTPDASALRAYPTAYLLQWRRPQLLGGIGALLLLFGVFLPVFRLPVVGSLNYWQVASTLRSANRITDALEATPGASARRSPGTRSSPTQPATDRPAFLQRGVPYYLFVFGPFVLLLLAAISLVLVCVDSTGGLYATGGAALALLIFLVVRSVGAAGRLVNAMGSDSSYNEMAQTLYGGKSFADLFGLHWFGIIALFLGAILLLLGAILRE